MNKTYDAVVIGAGIVGMATAYYLKKQGLKLAVIDRKYIGSGSTSRCIGGIRQQFSTPATIRLMKENVALFSQMAEEFGSSVDYYAGGYLFLAHTDEMLEIYKKNVALQRQEGVNVRMVSPGEIRDIVPGINTDGLLGGTFCPDDAQAYPFSVLKGYYSHIAAKGGDFYLWNPVVGIRKERHFIVTLSDGMQAEADKVVLSAGPWSASVATSLGLTLPLYPERHEAIITTRMNKFINPMIVDYRKDGCYFQQMLTGQVIGCYTPDPVVPGIHHDASFEFLPRMGGRMKRLIPALSKASILRHWAGCYTMTPDGNPIVDQSETEGFYIASGMCGHGFMLGPGIGKHLAHFMSHGAWDADFSEFALNRSFQGKEKMK